MSYSVLAALTFVVSLIQQLSSVNSVTKNVPENALVAGVPAVVKKIIDNEKKASDEYKPFDFERM